MDTAVLALINPDVADPARVRRLILEHLDRLEEGMREHLAGREQSALALADARAAVEVLES